MNAINDIFNGLVVISLLALAQHGCSVKEMATKAAKSHERGLSSYGGYSRGLTGSSKSWAE